MKPQRTAANDEGINWQAFWDEHIQQSDARQIEAANDNQTEPTSVGLSGLLMGGLLVLIVLTGALAGRV